MKATSLLVFITLLVFTSYSQDEKMLTGKWKVNVISNDNLYYSIKNDSVAIKKEQGEERIKNERMIPLIKESFKNSYFIFKENSEYEIVNSNKVEETGTFKINPEKAQMFMKPSNKFWVGEMSLKYELENSVLKIFYFIDGKSTQYEHARELK